MIETSTHHSLVDVAIAPQLRAAIYARSATAHNQSGENSLSWQVERCREYRHERGYLLDEQYIYQEVASGADCRNRPHLTAILMAASHREFDVVVIVAPDRLARNPLHLTTFREVLDTVGVHLEYVHESSESLETFFHLLHSYHLMHQRERLRTRRRSSKAMARQQVVVHDAAAALVSSLFEQASCGDDLSNLAASLNTPDGLAFPPAGIHRSVGGTWEEASH